jgi:hypothetical protein
MEEAIMRSNALAGVDAWLGQAEEVLRDQRERSLSPSSAQLWDAGQVERTMTMAELAKGLEAVLRVLCESPGRWVLIAESGPYRYLQALAFEDGALITEVVSNHWIEGNFRWTPEQERQLQDLGWACPDPPGRPNWLRVESTTSPDLPGVADQAVQTLQQVFGIQDEDSLKIKQFSSPNRGGTPATPRYVVEQVDSAQLPASASST